MKERSRVQKVAVYGGVGLALCSEISGASLAGYFIGTLVEAKIGGAPWWRVALLMVFLSTALWHMMYILKQWNDKPDSGEE